MKSDGAVVWKLEKDGDIDEVELGDNVQQHGQDLKVSDVDMPIVGEYSCWSGEKKISSTYLLLDPEEKNLDSLSCWANSYNCNFSCKWTNAEYTAVHLGVGPECSGGEKSCSWFAPGKTGTLPGGGGFQFELSHFFSPYTEESTMLEVTAEAINSYSFVRMTKRFYLRDIVQPDSPQIIACQEVGQELNVSIDPASSWSTPPSFYSLEHEIEYEYKDDGKTERSSSSLIPKGISRLRARSRDSVVRSTWSEWTDWKNVNY
ncbi:interleukin-12 subunit beta [Diretmus argenteus]